MSKRWRTKVCYVFEARKRKDRDTQRRTLGSSNGDDDNDDGSSQTRSHTHTHTHVQTPEHTQLNVEKFDLQPQSKETKEMVDMVKRC